MATTKRIALITGGSRGIGAAVCRALGREGTDVIVHCRSNMIDATAVVTDVRKHGQRALAVQASLAEQAEVEAMFEEISDFTDHLDIVVNNAGIYPVGGLEDISVAEWDEVMAVNVRGAFLVTRSAVALLRAGGPSGRIINVGSVMALKGTPGALHYVTSKAAIGGFTRGLASELAGSGITVNCVVPSVVGTETARGLFGGAFDDIVSEQLVPRLQQPEDLVGLVAFLASPASEFMTGQTLIADGGRVLT